METERKRESAEDREEGEIVEDEFEDVSDCSMSLISPTTSPRHSGKLLAPPEFSRQVSLSSISDDDIDDSRFVPVYPRHSSKRKCRSKSPHNTYKRKRKSSSKSRRNRKYPRCNYSGSSENERLERRRVLLNKALRRESQDEILHNSLQTRIKAMLYNNPKHSSSNDEEDLESLRQIALLSRNKEKQFSKENNNSVEAMNLENDIKRDLNLEIEKALKSDSDSIIVIDETEDSENNSEQRDSAHNSDDVDVTDDSELINLRLEALKSAMLRKSKERKKRKGIDNGRNFNVDNKDNFSIPDDVEEFDEIDKENNYLKDSTCVKPRKCTNESEKVLNESNPMPESDISLKPENDQNHNSDSSSTKETITSDTGADSNKGTNLNTSKEKSPEKNILDEDVDVLRAMLLASMSKKITNKTSENPPKLRQMSTPMDVNPISQVANKVLPAVRKITPSATNYQSLNVTVHRPIVRTIPNIAPNKTESVGFTSNKNLRPINPMILNKLRYNSKAHKWPQHTFEVKPLIINVNENSDSEDEVVQENVSLTETVEQFLKKQRAEVEAKSVSNEIDRTILDDINKQIEIEGNNIKISVNVKGVEKVNAKLKMSEDFQYKAGLQKRNGKNNGNSLNTFSSKAVKLSPTKEEKKSVLDKSINDLLLNKSSLKLLPKSQQIEYQKLRQQLLNAKKKVKLKRMMKLQSFKKDAKANAGLKKSLKPLNLILGDNDIQNSRNTKFESVRLISDKASIQEDALEAVTNLKNILDDIQTQQNGRLQMKGKYQQLVPLLREVNKASSERRENEMEIKKLLSELQRARTKLANSQQHFISLVQQLATSKEAIDEGDEGISKIAPSKEVMPQKENEMCTSTPNKSEGNLENSCDISILSSVITNDNLNTDVEKNDTSLINGDPSADQKEDATDAENNSVVLDDKHQQNIIVEKNFVQSSPNDDKVDECLNEMELVDPNDIEKVFVEQKITEKPLSEYISPLGGKESENASDPLKVLCPYDLFGVCRDKECPYRHCS